MNHLSFMPRRRFIQSSLAVASVGFWAGRLSSMILSAAQSNSSGKLGMFVYLDGKDPDKILKEIRQLGFDCCEVYLNEFAAGLAAKIKDAADHYQLTITALFTSGPGPQVYNFYEGPETIGLVPRTWRARRVAALKQASDFSRDCGISSLETHCGFIPENPNDSNYKGTVQAIQEIAAHCQQNGQTFLYHAGQETPITLLRTIQDVGLDNQGIGLDTANLIMYGKGHPLDALEIYGSHLKAVNAKDGLFPVDPRNLGRETPLGQGKVDFPKFLRRLSQIGYTAPIIIEREISGPQLYKEMKEGKAYLERILNQISSTGGNRDY